MIRLAFRWGVFSLACAAVSAPAAAAVTLAQDANLIPIFTAPTDGQAASQAGISDAWVSGDHGRLVVMADLAQRDPLEQLRLLDEQVIDLSAASVLPEPLSWGLTLAGLATIGWTLRARRRVTNLSFV